MTEQSALLLRKQLAGNMTTTLRANIVDRRAIHSETTVSVFSFATTLCLRHRSEPRKLTKQHNEFLYHHSSAVGQSTLISRSLLEVNVHILTNMWLKQH